MGMMGGGPAQMTATATNVYILRGNTLYSFDARTLKLIAQADLPMPVPSQFGPQGFPGAGGPPGAGPGGTGNPQRPRRPGGEGGGGN